MPKKSYKLIVIIVSSIVLIVVFGLLLVSKTNQFNGLDGSMIKTFTDLNGSYTIAEAELQTDLEYHVYWSIRYALEKMQPEDIKIIAYDGDGCKISLYSSEIMAEGKVSHRGVGIIGDPAIGDMNLTLHKGNASIVLLGNELKGKIQVKFTSQER